MYRAPLLRTPKRLLWPLGSFVPNFGQTNFTSGRMSVNRRGFIVEFVNLTPHAINFFAREDCIEQPEGRGYTPKPGAPPRVTFPRLAR